MNTRKAADQCSIKEIASHENSTEEWYNITWFNKWQLYLTYFSILIHHHRHHYQHQHQHHHHQGHSYICGLARPLRHAHVIPLYERLFNVHILFLYLEDHWWSGLSILHVVGFYFFSSHFSPFCCYVHSTCDAFSLLCLLLLAWYHHFWACLFCSPQVFFLILPSERLTGYFYFTYIVTRFHIHMIQMQEQVIHTDVLSDGCLFPFYSKCFTECFQYFFQIVIFPTAM